MTEPLASPSFSYQYQCAASDNSGESSIIQLTITELLADQQQQQQIPNSPPPPTTTTDNTTQQDKDAYFVQEPFDYIFEPDHYPPHPPTPASTPTPTPTPLSTTAAEHSYSKLTLARSMREIDGVLEYEYKSYTFKGDTAQYDHDEDEMLAKRLASSLDTCDDLLLDELTWHMEHTHLDADIRAISLSKWPLVGFGFELSKQLITTDNIEQATLNVPGDSSFFYVSRIVDESPAGFSLQLGDVIIEIDEMSLTNAGVNVNEADINAYLNDEARDNVHIMAVHESKFFGLLKHEYNDDNNMLAQMHANCEDMVIVRWKKNTDI